MIQSHWRAFMDIAERRSFPPEIVTQPHLYREQMHSTLRGVVVRQLAGLGFSKEEIQKICPLKMRRLQEILQKPCAKSS